MGHLAKQRDASFFRVFFNPYRYGVLTFQIAISVQFLIALDNPYHYDVLLVFKK